MICWSGEFVRGRGDGAVGRRTDNEARRGDGGDRLEMERRERDSKKEIKAAGEEEKEEEVEDGP